MLKEIFSPKPLINVRGELWDLSSPRIMGIANITPDSFFPGSRVTHDELLKYVEKMQAEGADIIDMGGYSSRPGADHIPEQQELDRIIPATEMIKKNFGIAISIDTFRSSVAREAVQAGADLINDISGGTLDDKMWETVKDCNIPYILMHMRGNPKNMQEKADYQDVVLEVIDDLQKKIYALNEMGIKDLIIDPGFGFSKDLDQNYQLLGNLEYLKTLERPMLIGVSRKSMIFRELQISPDEALTGTIALNMVALQKGASILRVHDVKAARETLHLYNRLKKEGNY